MRNIYPLFILFMFLPQSIIAMECAIPELNEKYAAADYVFMGSVIARDKIAEKENGICWTNGESCGSKIATIEIEKLWKGKLASDTSKVYSPDACYCVGSYFELGTKYIVFGTKSRSDSYEVKDLGGCYSEPFSNNNSEEVVNKLNELEKS